MDDDGTWITDQLVLKNMTTNFYIKLFTSSHIVSNRVCSFSNPIVLDDLDKQRIILPISMEEVRSNLFTMDPIKTPGRALMVFNPFFTHIIGISWGPLSFLFVVTVFKMRGFWKKLTILILPSFHKRIPFYHNVYY